MPDYTTLRLDQLLQTRVINTAGCHLGEIKDLIVDLEFQTVSVAILSCTGIVGKSNRLVGIPFPALSIAGRPATAALMLPDCVLKLDDGFDREDWPAITRDWVASIYRTYGFRPYWNRDQRQAPRERGLDRSRHMRWPAAGLRHPVTHKAQGRGLVGTGQRNGVARVSAQSSSRIE